MNTKMAHGRLINTIILIIVFIDSNWEKKTE